MNNFEDILNTGTGMQGCAVTITNYANIQYYCKSNVAFTENYSIGYILFTSWDLGHTLRLFIEGNKE